VTPADPLDELVAAVIAGAHYRHIHPDLVRQVGAQELAKGRRFKEAVKATRNKLHQVGGAYQEGGIDYRRALEELERLPPDPHSPEVQEFCRQMMAQHASTRERLPILDNFYNQILSPLGEIDAVLDVACGLNPLARAWMPLQAGTRYTACDIYADMVAFLNQFFATMKLPGEAWLCDLVQEVPQQTVKLALVLKTIPCLEQLDKHIGRRLLEGLPAEFVLVSFPVHSLGGRSKGMLENYEAHFREMVAGFDWAIERYEFSTELAFLIRKRAPYAKIAKVFHIL
jgi:16S rRNA (guanine(1405)-N(7))-methyltransferase